MNLTNVKTRRPCRKLDNKNEGPWPIVRVLDSSSYELQLPSTMKIHPVFHASLLHLDPDKPLHGQSVPDACFPIVADGEPEYVVEEILDSRVVGGWVKYKAKWAGYPHDRNYYYSEDFVGARALVDAFHEKYPNKPGPEEGW